jgi:hypothetical protein
MLSDRNPEPLTIYSGSCDDAVAEGDVMMTEAVRQGVTSDRRLRLSSANSDFQLCSSYPPQLVFPAGITDEQVATTTTSISTSTIITSIPATLSLFPDLCLCLLSRPSPRTKTPILQPQTRIESQT